MSYPQPSLLLAVMLAVSLLGIIILGFTVSSQIISKQDQTFYLLGLIATLVYIIPNTINYYITTQTTPQSRIIITAIGVFITISGYMIYQFSSPNPKQKDTLSTTHRK